MYVPTTFLPPVAEELHFDPSQGALLVSTIGLGSVLARLSVGLLADRYHGLNLTLSNSALVVGGMATVFFPFVTGYPMLLAYSFVFGASVGACLG